MPLSSVTYSDAIQWQLYSNNTGFQDTTQGPDGVSFSLPSLNVTTFNQVFSAQYTLAPTTSQTVNFNSFTNLVNESVTLLHALTLIVAPTGGPITIAPAGSNPFAWGFTGTTPAWTVTAGGVFTVSEPVTGPGQVLSGTVSSMTFTNNSGSLTTTLQVALLGSTT